MVQISAFFPSKILQIFSQFNLYFPPKKLFIGPPSPPKNKRIIYYIKFKSKREEHQLNTKDEDKQIN